jgi:hypothetical protein
MVMIGAMAAGLTSMVTSGVGNRIALEELRDRQYAADGAVEAAIAEMRVAIEAGRLGCGDTWATKSSLNELGVLVEAEVDCVAVAGPDQLPVRQYVGRFFACPDPIAGCTADDATVQALVGFETDAKGRVLDTAVRSWSVR